MVCTFFGHKDSPSYIAPKLEETIERLIKENDDIRFYVGYNGGFDRMVIGALDRLKSKYRQINYSIVLYTPEFDKRDFTGVETIYPEGIENAPKRFALDRRNRWMVNNSDAVICYVTHSYGGAYKFVAMAEKKKLRIINLSE